jgi:hypothetical protein
MRGLAYTTVFLLAFVPTARADSADVACVQIESDSLEIDGMLDDWGRRGKGPVACAYDDQRLYLGMVIEDDRITRRKQGAEDRLTLSVGNKLRLDFRPATQAVEASTKKVKGVELMDSLHPDGWSLEVAIARDAIPEWGPATRSLSLASVYHDVDGTKPGKKQTVRADLTFAGAASVLDAFLKSAKLKRGQLTFDTQSDVVSWPGRERVVAGGGVFAVLGENFIYLRLPVSAPEDLLDVRVVDAFGGGPKAIVTHYRQHGNGGSRELVRVWRILAEGTFESLLTVEVAKRMEQNAILNRWEFAPRKDRSGMDLIVEALPPEGFSEETFQESPAPDAVPIVLPWAAETKVRHRFDASGYTGAEVIATDNKNTRRNDKSGRKDSRR